MSTLNVLNITDGTTTKATSQVLNASNNGLGEIGTYALVTRIGAALTAGTEVSGTVIGYSGARYSNASNVTLLQGGNTAVNVGTWRVMGQASADALTLVVRIA